MQRTVDELLKDDVFEKAVLEIQTGIKDDVVRIHNYFNNDYLIGILENEIDDIVDRIRKSHDKDKIPFLQFEYYISGVYNEIRSKPSIERCEKIKEELSNKWLRTGKSSSIFKIGFSF